jgi:hypothetical protein
LRGRETGDDVFESMSNIEQPVNQPSFSLYEAGTPPFDEMSSGLLHSLPTPLPEPGRDSCWAGD